MAVELCTESRGTIDVAAAPDDVFAVLSDVRDSGAHFPGVESLRPEPEGAWTWELKKVGAGRVSLQTIYACRYHPDRAAGTVRWEPVEGVGNARVRGSWTIEPSPRGTRVSLSNVTDLRVPLPSILRRPAQALAERENERLIGVYLENLRRTFEGGDGRVRS